MLAEGIVTTKTQRHKGAPSAFSAGARSGKFRLSQVIEPRGAPVLDISHKERAVNTLSGTDWECIFAVELCAGLSGGDMDH